MTINQYLGLDRFDTDKDSKRWSHTKKYTAIVRAFGFENVRALLPFSKEELATALKEDKYLNSALPRSFDWDGAGRFKCSSLSGVYRCSFIGSQLTKLYESVGITPLDHHFKWWYENSPYKGPWTRCLKANMTKDTAICYMLQF